MKWLDIPYKTGNDVLERIFRLIADWTRNFVRNAEVEALTVTGNTLSIGDGADTDKVIEAANGDANTPKMQYDADTSRWQFSNNGTTWIDIPNSADMAILAPGSDTRNVIQPTGDWKNLVLKTVAGQTKNPFSVTNELDALKAYITPAGGGYFAGNVGIGTTNPGKPLDVAGAIRTNNQFISTFATGSSPFAVTSTTVNTNLNADSVDGVHSTTIFKDNDLVLNTNPFGGRKLYINSIDNAMYAADKKWVVTITRHLKTYGGESYPKLNPDYVGLYTITGSGGSGSTRTITNTPIPAYIVVFDDNTLKTATTHYTYDSATGIITLLFAPVGTVYVYGGHEIPQYLDSPVDATLSSATPFNGSYEDYVSTSTGDELHYLKVRVTPAASGYTVFDRYPYGKLFLSYYFQGTPDKAEYRVYNYNYRPHVPGWKKYDFVDFVGTKTGDNYIQTCDDQSNYGRTIMEFIVYGNATYGENYNGGRLTQIDWSLLRPNLASGATVTKFGANTLYGAISFASDNGAAKISINPAGVSYFNAGNVGIGTTNPTAQLHTVSKDAARVAFKVQGIVGQSEPLRQSLNSIGTVLESLDKDGILQTAGYRSSDGSAGATATTGGLTFKNGLVTGGTITAALTKSETEKIVSVGTLSTTSDAYARVSGPNIFYYDSGKYGGTVTVYFEVLGYTAHSSYTLNVELYNLTDSASVADSEVSITSTTQSTRARSSAITLTTGKEYTARYKIASAGQQAWVQLSRVIIQQEA